VLALFLLGILTRVAFTGQVLYHWDSINFAFSLEHFDVSIGQPHVPGYILYVYLGRLVQPLFGDAQTTFAAISVLSSGLAAAFLYLLGRDMYSRRVGAAASLLLLSSPLFWFYGEIALPHSLDMFAVILIVWLFYRLIRGDGWFAGMSAVVLTAVVFGIAGGLRPQTQVFLMPLALFVGWRIGWRRSLAALVVLGLVNLAWFIPLMALNGGMSSYFTTMSRFSDAFNTTTNVLGGAGMWGLMRNVRKLAMYTAYGWGFAAIPFGLAAAAWVFRFPARLSRDRDRLRGEISSLVRDTRLWLLVLWVGPTLAYYTLIHMGQQGLVFVYLPALLLLSAAALFELLVRFERLPEAALAGLAAANALVFLFAPTYPLGSSVKLLTLDTLREHDRTHLAVLNGIQSNFDPGNTMILASWWRFPQYYLREYPLVHFDVGARWELDEGQGSIASQTLDQVRSLGLHPDENGFLSINARDLGLQPDSEGYYYLIIFDEHLTALNRSADRQERLEITCQGRLTFIRFTQNERFYLGADAFDIISVQTGSLTR
jgi:hypothetical protein